MGRSDSRFRELFREGFSSIFADVRVFCVELGNFLLASLSSFFGSLDRFKFVFVSVLYRQRGRFSRFFVHSGMTGLAVFGVMVAPVIAQEFPGSSVDPWELPSPSVVLSATDENPEVSTLVSEKMRGEIIGYEVKDGDTVSTVAEKFGVSVDTIRWQNDLKSKDSIKVGQTLEILPVTGVMHKVKKGDTVYSIAKKFDTSPQAIVDFPFNTFADDETFHLAIGQMVVVPDGVEPDVIPWSPLARVRQVTPDAGTVVASGSFAWPAGGTITQRFAWYHKGIDIANRGAPAILAADAGTVLVAGWPDNYGYGNRVILDHGNGFQTLYAHLSTIYVIPGQSVQRGGAVGKMGSTGRSTGIHLHFEVIKGGARLNPLSVLQ